MLILSSICLRLQEVKTWGPVHKNELNKGLTHTCSLFLLCLHCSTFCTYTKLNMQLDWLRGLRLMSDECREVSVVISGDLKVDTMQSAPIVLAVAVLAS